MLQRQCFFDINQLLLIFSRFHSMRIQVESFVDWSFKAWFYDIDPISSAEVGWKSMPRCQVCSNEHRIFYSKQIPPRKISLAGFFRALDEHIFFFRILQSEVWVVLSHQRGSILAEGWMRNFPLGWGCRSWRSLCDRCPPSRSLELVVKTESPEGMDPKG